MRHAILITAALLLLAGGALAELAPGDAAPDFTLTDTAGREHHLQGYLDAGQTVVLEWFNPDCPFIKKHHASARTMNEAYAKVKDHDVVWLAINSGAPGKQGAGLERNRTAVTEYEMPFPVLLDESGEVGMAYGAKTTPHMFVIAADGTVAYNGAIDDNPSPSQMGETNYVLAALHAVLSGAEVEHATTKPYGCSVKYGK
ncbi:thioredoxin family protein [bacterium]|nr:thioredoxin family protein [bacterium]